MTADPLVASLTQADSVPVTSANLGARGFGWAKTLEGGLGAALLVVVTLSGILAPVIARYGPLDQLPDAHLLGMSAAHPLGTDEFGRDLMSRVLYGVRLDLLIIVVSIPAAAVLGGLLGALSAYAKYAGLAVDRIFDVLLAFPPLILGAAAAVAFGSGFTAIVLTVILANIPIFGRIARTELISQRAREYVVSAEVLGLPLRRILARHILPNALDPIIVQLALSASIAVFLEGGMSFVGIGIRPPSASLGNVLNGSLRFLQDDPIYAVGPILAVCFLVIGFNLVADAANKSLRR